MKKGQLVKLKPDSELARELTEFQSKPGTVLCTYNSNRGNPNAVERVDVRFDPNLTVWGGPAILFEPLVDSAHQKRG